MTCNGLPEFIPEEMEAPQLYQLATKLSNEVARLSKIVGGYEIAYRCADKEYKRQLAMAIVINQEKGKTATVVKAIAELEPEVLNAAKVMEEAEITLVMGKAELDGRDKQYQGVKKLIELKVQELRTFRG